MTAAGFWGLLIEPGKMYSQSVPASFKVTMASLGPEVDGTTASTSSAPATGRTTVMLRIEDQDDYAICSLTPGKLEQQPLDLVLKEGENIAFRVSGPLPIHLTGYYVAEEAMDEEDMSEYDSEDMAEEVEGEYDSEEESQFDSEEAQETVKKIMKAKRARKAAIESGSEDSDDGRINCEDEEDEGESCCSHDDDSEDDEDEEDDEEIDSDDFEDMSETDFIDDDSDEEMDSDEDEESEEEEIVPHGKRSNAPAKAERQPEPKKAKTAEVKVAEEKKAVSPKQDKTQSQEAKQSPAVKQNQEAKKENTPNKQQQQQQPQSEKKVVKTLPSGLMLEDIVVGTGAKVSRDRRVGITYIGRLQNGKVFDQSKGKDLLWFNVGRGEVVKGMDIGVQGMAVGGKRRLTIPAALAYGSQSLPGIPANSTLVFEVTIDKMTGGK